MDRPLRALEHDIYGSGIPRADWAPLRNYVFCHLSFDDGLVAPEEITPPELPDRLRDYPVAKLVDAYRAERDVEALDKAMRLLVPDCEDYYVVLAKS